MVITPDTKNWTWVIERPCPECGFDAATIGRADVAELIRDNAAAWPAVLARHDVRDVLRLYDYRLTLMLDRDDPEYPNWDQDATAVAERYNEQDPAVVGGELASAASALAARFEALTDDQWLRPGRRGDGVSFTVESFARYFVHDIVHHRNDVGAAA